MSEVEDKVVSNMTRVIVVGPDETLDSIAAKYYGNEELAEDLARINGIARRAILTAGTKLKIPHRAAFARKRLAHKIDTQLSDIPQPPVDAQGVTEVTVTGERPWFLNPYLWIGAAFGFALAYFLPKSKRSR